MKKYEKKHVGEKWKTNEGYVAEIINGGSKAHYCTVKIENLIFEVEYRHLKNGVAKYPYHPLVYNIGYIGVGHYKVSKKGTITKVYKTWHNMLQRCYNKKHQSKHPTYKGCTVCEDWHNFQVFGEWFDENYQDGYALDKDLLVPGNKVYSPETCVFLPQRVNNFLTNNKSSNTSRYPGVSWHKESKKWRAQIKSEDKVQYLGLFNDIKDAAEAYKRARKIETEKLKELYKDVLPQYILEKIR